MWWKPSLNKRVVFIGSLFFPAWSTSSHFFVNQLFLGSMFLQLRAPERKLQPAARKALRTWPWRACLALHSLIDPTWHMSFVRPDAPHRDPAARPVPVQLRSTSVDTDTVVKLQSRSHILWVTNTTWEKPERYYYMFWHLILQAFMQPLPSLVISKHHQKPLLIIAFKHCDQVSFLTNMFIVNHHG